MHMRQGNPRLASESVVRGMAMLDEVREKLRGEASDSVEELYREGRLRLQELTDEAEAHCSSTRS